MEKTDQIGTIEKTCGKGFVFYMAIQDVPDLAALQRGMTNPLTAHGPSQLKTSINYASSELRRSSQSSAGKVFNKPIPLGDPYWTIYVMNCLFLMDTESFISSSTPHLGVTLNIDDDTSFLPTKVTKTSTSSRRHYQKFTRLSGTCSNVNT